MPVPLSTFLGVSLAALATGSLAVWVAIGARLRNGVAVVPVEIRQEVPWGGIHLVLLLVAMFLVQAMARYVVGVDAAAGFADLDATAKAKLVTAAGFLGLLGVVAGAVALVYGVGASLGDLGFPTRFGTLLADVRLGALAFLAVSPPVYALKVALVQGQLRLDQQPVEHPLIKMLQSAPDAGTIAVAIFAAVCAAPVFEEFVFRLLIQGWFEKVASRRIGRPSTRVAGEAVEPMFGEDVAAEHPPRPELPDAGSLPGGLPCGYWPILVSSALFAMMHAGHGVDPIPLFMLALGFGYLYRQTHRMTPGIVLHTLFNAFSLAIFWAHLALGGN